MPFESGTFTLCQYREILIVGLQLLTLNLSLTPEGSSNFWPNKSLQNLSLLREQTQSDHSQKTVKEKWSHSQEKDATEPDLGILQIQIVVSFNYPWGD